MRGRWRANQTHLINQDKNGTPMLKRWIVLGTPFFGIYVHFIYKEDLQRDPHDHPWWFFSFIIRGGYTEEYVKSPGRYEECWSEQVHKAGRVRFFPLRDAHRINSVRPNTTSIVLVGPKVRYWGFYSGPKWIPWTDYKELA